MKRHPCLLPKKNSKAKGKPSFRFGSFPFMLDVAVFVQKRGTEEIIAFKTFKNNAIEL